MTLPIGTASVERSFSQMKLIKTGLRNRLGELSLSRLMKIAIESPETLFDSNLEEVVTIWNKKVEELQLKLLTCSQTNSSKQACVGLVAMLLRYHWWLILVVVFSNCLCIA